MDSDKQLKILELQRQIEEIKKDKPVSFALVKVTPDCGGGIMDRKETLAISFDQSKLVTYCDQQFNYIPIFEKQNDDNKKPCDVWYQLSFTTIQILN